MNWTIPTLFEIISLGDSELLAQAFNGLAAITNANGFVNMTKAAFLVGILAFGARAVMTNRFELTVLLSSLLVYIVMFGPRASVHVIDYYNGQARVVANVPVGVAAPFALVSTTGKFFAETFETAFAVIGPSSQYLGVGYLDALSVFLRMRDMKPGAANSPDAAKHGDLMRSAQNYVVQCVMYDLELNDAYSTINRNDIRTAINVWDKLKSDLVNVRVVLFMPDGLKEGQIYNCKDAWTVLNNYFAINAPWQVAALDPWLKTNFEKPLGADVSAMDRVQGALNAIGLSTQSANQFVMNSFMATVLRNSNQGYYVNRQDVTSAMLISSAENQRNVQWVAERTMFEKVARPVTAFIEVFLVAATPLMAFAVAAFGMAGVQTLGKYLLLHFWVTLWAPTLAIANMYTYTRVNRYIEYLMDVNNGGVPLEPMSLMGIDTITQQLQTEYATGSMLAASVPMLTLLLIYGSSQVASRLADKMSSAEQVDAKLASPSVMSSAPVVANQSLFSGSPALGYGVQGAAAPTVAMSQTALHNQISSQSALESNARQLGLSYGRQYRDSRGYNAVAGYSAESGWSAEGGGQNAVTATLNAAFAASKGVDNKIGNSSAYSVAVAEGLMADAGLRADLSGIMSKAAAVGNATPFSTGMGADISKRLALSKNLDASNMATYLNSLSQVAGSETSVGRHFRQSISASGKFSDGYSVTRSGEQGDSKALSAQWSNTLTASRNFTDAKMATDLGSGSATYTPAQLYYAYGQRAGGDPNWQSKVAEMYAKSTYGGDPAKQQAALENTKALIRPNMSSFPGANLETAAMLFNMAQPDSGGIGAIGSLLTAASRTHQGAYAAASENRGMLGVAEQAAGGQGNLAGQVLPAVASVEGGQGQLLSNLDQSSQDGAAFKRKAHEVPTPESTKARFGPAVDAFANSALNQANQFNRDNQAERNYVGSVVGVGHHHPDFWLHSAGVSTGSSGSPVFSAEAAAARPDFSGALWTNLNAMAGRTNTSSLGQQITQAPVKARSFVDGIMERFNQSADKVRDLESRIPTGAR